MKKLSIILFVFVGIATIAGGILYYKSQNQFPLKVTVESQHPLLPLVAIGSQKVWNDFLAKIEFAKYHEIYLPLDGKSGDILKLQSPIKTIHIILVDQPVDHISSVFADLDGKKILLLSREISYDEASQALSVKIHINGSLLSSDKNLKEKQINAVASVFISIAGDSFANFQEQPSINKYPPSTVQALVDKYSAYVTDQIGRKNLFLTIQ